MSNDMKQKGGDNSTNIQVGGNLVINSAQIFRGGPAAAAEEINRSLSASILQHFGGMPAAYTAITVPQSLPTLPLRLSGRKQSVEQILAQSGSAHWIAVNGPCEAGKSVLAILIARARGGKSAWIQTQANMKDEEACFTLDIAVARITEANPSLITPDNYASALASIACPTTVVVDNLPSDLSTGLTSRLFSLAQACALNSAILVTTNSSQLPKRIVASHSDLIFEISAPPLTERETGEILVAYGATDAQAQNYSKLILAVGGGHPTMTIFAADYLAKHHWKINDSDLTELLTHKFSDELKPDVVRRLLATIPDDETRDYLYRLNLAIGTFSEADARAAAEVSPAISRSVERLYSLIGPWVQRKAQDRMTVSHLLKCLGNSDLDKDVMRSVHSAYGKSIFKSKTVDDISASAGITHLIAGQDFDIAALLLATILWQAGGTALRENKSLLLHIWMDSSLPDEMNLNAALFLRSIQISTLTSLGEDCTFAAQDLLRLAAHADAASIIALALALLVSTDTLAQTDLAGTLRILRDTIQLWPSKVGPFGIPAQDIPESSDISIINLSWLITPYLKQPEDLESWLDAVEKLEPRLLEEFASHELAADGFRNVSRIPWMAEHKKPHNIQNWGTVLKQLEGIENRALGLGLDLLEAWSVCGRIVVLADYQKELVQAVSVGTSFLEAHESSDSSVKYAIQDCIGRQYLYAGDHENAAHWLEIAAGQPTKRYSDERIGTYVNLARVCAALNKSDVSKWTNQAVEIAFDEDAYIVNKLQALGEHAVSLWFEDKRLEAFRALSQGVKSAMSVAQPDNLIKEMTVKLLHVGTCFFDEIEPVAEESTSGQAKLSRGLFLGTNPKIAERYQPSKIETLMAAIAAGVDSLKEVEEWAFKGFYKENASLSAVAMLSPQVTTSHLLAGEYEEGLKVALKGGKAFAVMKAQLEQSGDASILQDYSIGDGIPETLAPDLVISSERHTLNYGAIPALLALAVRMVEQHAGKDEGVKLATIIHDFAACIESPQVWLDIETALRNAFVEKIPYKDMANKGMEEGNAEALQFAYYLLASLNDAMSLKDAFNCHRVIISWAETASYPDALASLFTSFIESFWSKKFKERSYEFLSPRLVDSMLNETSTMKNWTKTAAILKAISTGLGVR